MAAIKNIQPVNDPWGIGSGSTYGPISASSWMDPPRPMEHAIQGRMLVVNYVVSDWEMNNRPISPDEIKLKLNALITEKMAADKHIEYTKMLDPFTGQHKFAARIFVVPDTQVRLIRENKVDTVGPW